MERPLPAAIAGYQVIRELARGGQGVVLAAHGPGLGRDVAIKLLLGEAGAGTQLERFRREARAVARLRHPNIVQVHQVGEEQGVPFIVMDLLQGGSLRDLLGRRGRLGSPEVARLGASLARALQHAHEQGVLHRDVKPHNVLLRPDGEPVLTDFGLASDARDARLTASGVMAGTPAYMSPEQAEGLHGVDARADVYSLGATLYELLTGRAPFVGGSALEILKRVVADEPAAPSSLCGTIDPRLEAIVLRCLQKDPARRFQRAADLAAALEGLERPGTATPGPVPARGAWLVVGGLGVATALVAGVVAWSSAPAGEEPARAVPAPEASRVAPAPQRSPEETRRAAALELVRSAREQLERGEIEGALRDADAALRLDPRTPGALAARGEARVERGELEPALADLRGALELDSGPAAPRLALIRALVTRGELQAALEVADQALALEPENARFRHARGWVLRQQGDREGALREFSRAIELDPRGADSWALRGEVHLELDQAEAARTDLERALELDPDFPRAWSNLGSARLGRRDLRGALAAYDEAARRDPGPLAWKNRATILYQLGEWARAHEDAQRAIEADPRDPVARMVRGFCRARLGQRQGAIEDLEAFLAGAAPGDGRAAQARNELARLRAGR